MLARLSVRRLVSPPPCPASWTQALHHSAWRIVRPRHPAFADLGAALTELPRFRTRGEAVRVLYEPREFYETLLARIGSAKRRIFIASLYVGKEETELIAALHSALSQNPDLRVTILLDYLRSTRETPRASSASLVATLTAAFPSQVEFRLFHTPNLTGWKKKIVGRRFDEGWGLQHMKVYGFDDNVIISGANLSNDYFTNRQDRYMEFIDHSPLADYFVSMLATVASFSFRVTALDASSKSPPLSITWPSTNATSSPLDSRTSISSFKAAAHSAFSQLTVAWARKPGHSLCSALPPPTSSSSTFSQVYDTSIRPVLQMGSFSIAQETELVVPTILRTANSLATAPGGTETTVDWTSGYFSVREEYREKVLDSRAAVRIVTASPEANGFYGSKGVSKYIPPAYTHFLQLFFEQTKLRAAKRKRETHVELREWKREGWTYHAKGIWLTPSLSSIIRQPLDNSPLADPHDLDLHYSLSYPKTPFLTLIGSSNYGRRSAERDLEVNLLVTTFDKGLRSELQEEIHGIRHFATDKVDDRLFRKEDRRVGRGVKLAAKLIEDML